MPAEADGAHALTCCGASNDGWRHGRGCMDGRYWPAPVVQAIRSIRDCPTATSDPKRTFSSISACRFVEPESTFPGTGLFECWEYCPRLQSLAELEDEHRAFLVQIAWLH
jgi:hypothetical protein